MHMLYCILYVYDMWMNPTRHLLEELQVSGVAFTGNLGDGMVKTKVDFDW